MANLCGHVCVCVCVCVHACVFSDCVFVILYIYMAEHWILPQQLFAVSSFLTVVGYLCNIIITGFFRDVPGAVWTCAYAMFMDMYSCN